MRILVAVIALLFFPALAEARPVCGPSKARTLATTGEARLYKVSDRTYGCSRGKRPVGFGAKVTRHRLAGRFAAVIRADRVTVYDLRARKATVHGERAGRIHAFTLTASGHAGWIAVDGDDRTVFVNESTVDGGDDVVPSFLGLAGNVSLIKSGAAYRAKSLSRSGDMSNGTLARIGAVRLEASDSVVFVRASNERRLRLDAAYTNESSSTGGGLDRLLIAGTTVAGRSNRYKIAGELDGGEVRVVDVAKVSLRTTCETPRAVRDIAISRSGRVACVVEGDVLNRIESDGLVIDRFDRTPTTLAISKGKLTWKRDGQTFAGPLPSAVVCGPG